MRAKTTKFKKVFPKDGVHICRLVHIIDWGSQVDKFSGPEGRPKLELIWEVPKSLHVFNEDKGPQPLIIDRKYGNTLGTAKKRSELGKAVEGMLGTSFEDTEENPFDLSTMIGTLCQIQTSVENDGQYENLKISAIMALPEGVDESQYPEYNDQYVLDLDDFNPEIWELLPKWKKEEIAKTAEYALAISGEAPQAEPELIEEEYVDENGNPVDVEGNPLGGDILDEIFGEEPAPAPVAKPAPVKPVQAPVKKLVPGQGFKAPVKTVAKPPVKAPVKTVAKPAVKTIVRTVSKPPVKVAAKPAPRKFK